MSVRENTYAVAGRIAVVTGGAQGIGFAVAAKLLANGARVALWDLNVDKAQEAAQKLSALGEAIAVECNVSGYESVTAALARTESALGGVDILVNSAGIAGSNATIEDYDVAEFQQIVNINLMGTFYTNKAVITGMKARNFGRIVNIASIAGKEGNPNAGPYSASKAGVIGLTKSIGKELAGFDIACNCVTPAAARTPIFDQLSEEFIEYMLSKIPRNRFLEVEEVASMIGFMVSPENSFTTGAVFDLSGGRATY